MYKFDKAYRQLKKAHTLCWLESGREHQLKLTKSHMAVYEVLLNDFNLYRKPDYNPTFSMAYLAYESGVKDRTCRNVVADLERAQVIQTAPRNHKEDGTYKVTEYLNVVFILDSPKHKLLLPEPPWMTKSKTEYNHKQIQRYQANQAYAIERGYYLSEEEKAQAYDRNLRPIDFKWET
jgi:hypothetical protein